MNATMNRTHRRAALKAARRAPPAAPRRVDPHAAFNAVRHTRAANSTEPLDKAQLTDLALGYHSALHALMNSRRGAMC